MLRSSSGSLTHPTRRFVSSLRSKPSRVSSRTRNPSTAPEPEASSRLPRYLRRRTQFSDGADRADKPVYSSSSKTPLGKNGKQPIKLLEPHVLSTRLKTLCEKGKVGEAVNYLKSTPLDAQNTPVWNTLMWECMKASKFSTAYSLYTEMKRRGFSPTTRTYSTLLNGLSRIKDWHIYSKQLKHANSVYTYFIRHLQSVQKEDPQSPDLDISPLAFYIKILGDAGQYQQIFDVYYQLEPSGPLAANHLIYTSMFSAIARFNTAARKQLNASTAGVIDTKLLWTQTVKASQRPKGFTIDPHLVTCAIQALSGGRQAEQALAFQLVRDYFGLTKPGDVVTTGKFPLSPQALIAALMLCNSSHKPTLCVHYFQQLVNPRSKLFQQNDNILDRGHMEEVLKAYVTLAAIGAPGQASEALNALEYMTKQEFTANAGPKIRPTKSTYELVLMACWRGADWTSACSTFSQMTGLRTTDFETDKGARHPKLLRRSPGRNFEPDAETMSSMLRTAISSGNSANVAQCLRIVSYLTTEKLFVNASASKKQAKHERFYQAKLAQALTDAVDAVVPRPKGAARKRSSSFSTPADMFSQEQIGQWKELRERLKPDLALRPHLEQDIRPVQDSDSFVEYETVQRNAISPLSASDMH
jgi:pentatricopeptide repeat protein